MQNFVRVTKDNQKRDRGFIAVDAICSVFENQEDHNTQIMTMDGMWYDVVDDIEKLYSACENSNTVCEEKKKGEFIRKRRMQSSALSEKSCTVQKPTQIQESGFKRVRSCGQAKRFRKTIDRRSDNTISSDFSPGGEEGHYIQKPTDVNMSRGDWL